LFQPLDQNEWCRWPFLVFDDEWEENGH
jgi:hypothetical protein